MGTEFDISVKTMLETEISGLHSDRVQLRLRGLPEDGEDILDLTEKIDGRLDGYPSGVDRPDITLDGAHIIAGRGDLARWAVRALDKAA